MSPDILLSSGQFTLLGGIFSGPTGTEFATVAVLLVVALIGLIYVMRSYFNKQSSESLAQKYADTPALDVRNKYPEADSFRLSGTFFNLGLAMAIGLAALAFGVTQYEEKVLIPDGALEMDEDIEIEPPRTAEPPPPPPPPPPPVIQAVPDELVEEETTFEDASIDEETVVERPAPVAEKAPPPPPPPPPPVEETEIFKVVEQMPRFPGCENAGGTEAEKKQCADKKMLEFIYKNIKYPAIARENGVEGTAVITFVVEKDGKVSDVQIVRDIGAQCGSEAMRVVNLMNEQGIKWTPGKQRGRPVRVQFNLPVKFKLE